jgi:hypothetical protein
MLQALLRGKLSREQENLEDLLTCAVFGPLSYLSAERGLLPLLRLARFPDGTMPAVFDDSKLVVKEFAFWPVYATDCAGPTEPDVLISALDFRGRKHLILIEVKLWSPKSSRPDSARLDVVDQLAREWCVLIDRCKAENASPHMIYVTADSHFPSLEIGEGNAEFSAKCPLLSEAYPMHCAWLSWLGVADAFENHSEPVLVDIAAACRRLDLVRFRGFLSITRFEADWTFTEYRKPFDFAAETIAVGWSYQ